ncbi:MAG: hypothetical protein ACO1N8_06490 [Methylophilus sp.]
MQNYHHHVSGIFQRHADALTALEKLIEKGLPSRHMQIFESNTPLPEASTQSKSNEVLKNMLVQGSVGTAVGTGLGALTQVALVAANVSLFIASPLIAPLAMLGWGATLGATAGAAIGAMQGNKASTPEKEG